MVGAERRGIEPHARRHTFFSKEAPVQPAFLSIFVTTEGFEPTFSHPITIICLEGKLVYVAIFCSFTGTQTQILDLGNPCPIQLNDEAMCGLSKIRTCIFGFVDRCPNPLDDETVVPLIGFEPTFATQLQITVSKTELVTSVFVPTVRIELTCDHLHFQRLMRAR